MRRDLCVERGEEVFREKKMRTRVMMRMSSSEEGFDFIQEEDATTIHVLLLYLFVREI